jgi:hypothetical protein
MQSALESCQLGVIALLQAQRFFAPLPLMHERMEDLKSKLNITLKSKTGILVLVNTPDGKNITPGAPFVTLEVTLLVDVLENVMFNQSAKGTRISANAAGEQVAAHLHNQLWVRGKALPHVDMQTFVERGLVICRNVFSTKVQLEKL